MKRQFSYYLTFLRRKLVIVTLLSGVLLGIVLIGLVRFAASSDHETHYHADFAVFINGKRVAFDGPQYYQEFSACEATATPLGRVHLHDQNNHLIHVHADVVTWSDLFANLGWSLNNSMLFDGTKAYVDGQGGHLNFVLNGKATRSIATEIIGDKDRLMVSFGTDDEATLQKQFSQVQTDAKQADETADPATCQGPEHKDMWTRLRTAFFF